MRGGAALESVGGAMFSRSLPRLAGAALLLLALALGGCSGASTVKGPILVPLKVLSASMEVDPKNYSGPCSGAQNLTFTATLAANPSNAGGAVHYVWTVAQSVSEGDVTFGPGEVSKTLTHAVAYTVPADAGSELRASFATTTPNAVNSPDAVFVISCTVGFQITGVSVTMQPWSTGCGYHTFGWSAVLTAPWNNTGGQAHYTWKFAGGATQDGTFTFPPGQVTGTVAAEHSYDVEPAGSGIGIPASQIIAWLYVDSPNTISDYAVLDHFSC
jgi:hypothetical protein